MEGRERAWVRGKLREHYSRYPPKVVELEKREFGVGDFGRKIVRRHLSFREENFQPFLVDEAPLYISHSIAYYRDPSATPMEAKGFLGADLVFDLDGSSWKEVVADTVKLVERLKEDFNVRAEVNFSGNRGFHVHVREKDYLSLMQEERKEIASYLSPAHVDWRPFFWEEGGMLRGPKEGDPGLGGQLVELVKSLSREWESFRKAYRITVPRETLLRNIREGNWTLFASSLDVLLRKVERLSKGLHLESLNIDSGVTYDVSKLIRVPDSVHGSTGFLAKRLRVEKLEEFNPYRDAVILREEKTNVVGLKGVRISPWDLVVRKGERKRVWDYQALFLLLKGYARLP